MKVAIQKRKGLNDNPYFKGIPWTAVEPFVMNEMAQLIHRVRHVSTHKIGNKYPSHLAINMWCGNSATGTKKFTFLGEPPVGRIVCARCDAAAIAAGLPSSTQIAGRHVHTGGVVAVAHCCQQEKTQ